MKFSDMMGKRDRRRPPRSTSRSSARGPHRAAGARGTDPLRRPPELDADPAVRPDITDRAARRRGRAARGPPRRARPSTVEPRRWRRLLRSSDRVRGRHGEPATGLDARGPRPGDYRRRGRDRQTPASYGHASRDRRTNHAARDVRRRLRHAGARHPVVARHDRRGPRRTTCPSEQPALGSDPLVAVADAAHGDDARRGRRDRPRPWPAAA